MTYLVRACRDCVSYRPPKKGVGGWGVCRRFPPQIVDQQCGGDRSGAFAFFPAVLPETECEEFVRLSTDRCSACDNSVTNHAPDCPTKGML